MTNKVLNPEQATAMLEAADAVNPSPIRQLANQILHSGAVNEGTSIADIPAIVAWDATAQG